MTARDADLLPPQRGNAPSRPRSPVPLPAVVAAEGAALAVLGGPARA